MNPESFTYTLTLGGRYAGSQDWVVRPDRGNTVVRVQTEFGGALPAGRQVQESRLDPGTGFSLAYAEAEGGTRKPGFETIFDERSGLVTLRQGKDEATTPLLEGHHDPLSLLHWLRGWRARPLQGDADAGTPPAGEPSGPAPTSLRLVGGRVHVQPLPDSSVQGVPAWAYFLRPGGAYVYVEQAAPHRLLRLIQPSDFGPVEALLGLSAPASGPQRPGTAREREQTRAARSQPGKPRRRK